MNDEELLKRMTKEQSTDPTRFIAVSSDSTAERMNRTLQWGTRGYLQKPFTPEAGETACPTLLHEPKTYVGVESGAAS